MPKNSATENAKSALLLQIPTDAHQHVSLGMERTWLHLGFLVLWAQSTSSGLAEDRNKHCAWHSSHGILSSKQEHLLSPFQYLPEYRQSLICIFPASPWLLWLSGLSVGLRTKGSPVRFPVRAHAWVMGRVLSGGHVRGNHTLMFLSLSFSLPSPLSKNK